ncbi:hypothetical protein [Aequorivita viscosa]|uniref:DUF937 domain-containing protein n=1 Tax=Aequorivita viscosa TaxID=797419 RepID=A0A1M6F3L0_9FLAO|nr:hypothetical protein [Aequorivita viscosa]SDW64548.1 hypothetical protein SAMN05216556_10836 [Aequorivita viscosa]SHI92265.1 hypothetical protein SAMN04487908_10735 [Aequorivita viscosa]
MIEQIIGKLKSEIGGQLTSQTELSSGNLDSVFSIVGDVVKSEATKEMLGGNISSLINLFSDKPNDAGANKIQSQMSSGIVGELMGKLGISPEQSNKIVAIALPALLNMIAKKKDGDSNDDSSFLGDLLGNAGSGGIGGMAKGLLGGFLK